GPARRRVDQPAEARPRLVADPDRAGKVRARRAHRRPADARRVLVTGAGPWSAGPWSAGPWSAGSWSAGWVISWLGGQSAIRGPAAGSSPPFPPAVPRGRPRGRGRRRSAVRPACPPYGPRPGPS